MQLIFITSLGLILLFGFNSSAFEKVEVINNKINTLKIVFILNNYSDVLYLLLLIIITKNIGRINVKSVTTINKIPSSE